MVTNIVGSTVVLYHLLPQSEQVMHNQNNGVIISNHSLVLQKVTRSQAGSYTCEASNVEGDEVSNPVAITIMCKFLDKFDTIISSRFRGWKKKARLSSKSWAYRKEFLMVTFADGRMQTMNL